MSKLFKVKLPKEYLKHFVKIYPKNDNHNIVEDSIAIIHKSKSPRNFSEASSKNLGVISSALVINSRSSNKTGGSFAFNTFLKILFGFPGCLRILKASVFPIGNTAQKCSINKINLFYDTPLPVQGFPFRSEECKILPLQKRPFV